MQRKYTLALGACALLSGCATNLSQAGSSVIQADEKMVADCAFIGNVEGSSGFGNIAAGTGMANSRNEATEKAAKLGATHILFTNISGGYSPSAQARAYKCAASKT